VLPLVDTPVHPNHVTTAALATGLCAGALFAAGTRPATDVGAALYVVSALLDHADGELARAGGKCSAFGAVYDRVADLAVKLTLFLGMGVGASGGTLGAWPAVLGAAAGVALVTIFTIRSARLKREGPSALEQPSAGGFEIEDVLYVIAPVAWLGLTGPFVVLAGVGAPLFACWVAWQALRARRRV
jgi:phosphatidylglycerophosphate synthase